MVTQNTFTGEYSYSVDAKGRINVPAKFRAALSAENDSTFVITKGMDPCLVAYPVVEWRKVEEGLRSLSSASGTYRSFIRSTVRHATHAKLDKQGRIQIPPALRDFAGIERQVLIIGVVNKIEIWNPSRLETLEEESLGITPEQFEELANKIIL